MWKAQFVYQINEQSNLVLIMGGPGYPFSILAAEKVDTAEKHGTATLDNLQVQSYEPGQ